MLRFLGNNQGKADDMFCSNRIIRALCCVGIFTLAQPVLAATDYQCVGAVNDVSVLPNGTLAIGTYSDAATPDTWLFLCNVNSAVDGGNGPVPTTVCKSWQTVLVTAQVTNRNVRIWFGDSASCGTHAMFTVADIDFGPALEN